MEKKQLNFNVPLLSVRKSTPTLSSSDGLNKKMVERSPSIRQQSLHIPKSNHKLGEVKKPAAIPFLWEQIPGRPKGKVGNQAQTPQPSASAPRLPPGRISDVGRHCLGARSMEQKFYKSQFEAYPIHDHAALIESLRESLHENGESDSESLDDIYSDVIDSPSLAESFSLNCSLSGLSGFEVPNVKSLGTFYVDPQTKDFMMNRFLPAAKSVVLEMPRYIPRKQPIVAEQPKQAKTFVNDESKAVLDCHNSNLMCSHYQCTEDVKSEGEEDGHDDQGKLSGRAWGIFPHLCLKKSLCLLNPVPAMKTRTQAPKSPATNVKRLSRKAYSGPVEKPAWDSRNKRIFHSGVLSQELHHVESKLCKSKKRSYSRASYKGGGPFPCRPFRSVEISPYWNVPLQFPFTTGTTLLCVPKQMEVSTNQNYRSSNNMRSNALDVFSPRVCKRERVSINKAVEKTLYVDSVNGMNPYKKIASSAAAISVNPTDKNLKLLAESRSTEEFSLAKSSIHEVRPLDLKSSILDDRVLPSSPCISMVRGKTDKIEDAKLDHSISTEARSLPVNNEAETQTDLTAAIVQIPLPPPLPKSPSESWLWRTVPSIYVHNPLSHSHPANQFQPKRLGQNASTAGTKWETIVKTSNLHYGRGRYSEEVIAHISHKHNKI